ncbi:MAG: DUF4315 family protein [Lachnospiraceae bacterium]|nr:DUF4315 family protein [Lachnospiraceae bacterium]MCD8034842.1 DUF4315 family protein [Alistipes sp.]MCD8159616.1 DUF4315 family protein [Clostridiales bacterium]
MSAKLDKIGAEREKARQKRDEWDARYKELDRKYHEQENVDIHEMVHAAKLSPEQLGELLRMVHDAPGNILSMKEDTQHED